MNTTAEKKRILSMPTVQGELKIKNHTYRFGCIKESNDGFSKCVMINRDKNQLSSYTGDQAHILTDFNSDQIEIWVPGFASGYLSQMVPYSEITILWSTYQGIPQTQKAELLQAA